MKPKLLVVELWGVGDLAIATPFLQAAGERYEVSLLAKPYAQDLQRRFWPEVKVIPVVAPWTAFKHKYRLFAWPWLGIMRLWRTLLRQQFDLGLSARWDPRDHLLLALIGARRRVGFARMRSQILLSETIVRPDPTAHRYEHWRVLGQALGLEMPPREGIHVPSARPGVVLVHTGAGQPVRVWPLERYQGLVRRLRERSHEVQVACDPDQRQWWLQAGEPDVATPQTVSELLDLLDRAAAFIGNDSGPGHLAAFNGVPTFTLFGPQLPEWFAPLHPQATWIEGKACPHRPCSDYCRFPVVHCMDRLTEEEVWSRIDPFLAACHPSETPGHTNLTER